MCMCVCEFVQMHVYMYTMGLLLRWLAHLMLYCTDEAKLSQNNCLQLHFWHLFLKLMYIYTYTWFDSCHDCPASLEYSVVDDLLVLCELSIGREGASDVTGIATVLTTHVKQTAQKKKMYHSVHVHVHVCVSKYTPMFVGSCLVTEVLIGN